MKNWLKPIILFLLVVGFLGGLVAVSGVMNIAASSGHWPITAWFLNFGKNRYLDTYTLMTKVPPLEDEGMIIRGAGHYEISCRVCHGGPDHKSYLGEKMTPKSPFLPPRIKKYKPDELFRVVKHGIKFTGMPAWPDLHRDDEVWAMVAFLQKLPEMTSAQYKKLVYCERDPLVLLPSPYSGELNNHILMTCSNCHGPDGNGRGEEAFPKLAGQNQHYLEETLKAFKKGERHSGTMELMAKSLSDKMIKSVAEYYSKQKRKRAHTKEYDVEILKLGKDIALNGIPHQHVAACTGCHGVDQSGKTRKPHFPDLRGQPAQYLTNQLRLFLGEHRGGTEHLKLMKKAVHKLTEEQQRAVAIYYESLLHKSVDNHPSKINKHNQK